MEDTLFNAAANCAGAYQFPVKAMGRPWERWDDLWASDLGLPASAPPNNATLLAPLAASNVDGVLDRLDDLFSRSSGGGYQVWSFWPLPDPGRAVEAFGVPCMIRPPGGEAPAEPPELEVVEAAEPRHLDDVGEVLASAFGVPAAGREFYDQRVVGTAEFRLWVGYVDGRAVSTATGFVGNGFVGVYAVATLAEMRGRGYGETLSWRATLADPRLPATLQASEMGRPVYERMGYRTVAHCSVWGLPRPTR